MCTYLGSYPPSIARTLITKWVDRQGTIIDPFCGRGTTLFEAAQMGYPFFGCDLNPLAVSISQAKLTSVSLRDVLHRLTDLARKYEPTTDIEALTDDIRIIFHERTLLQLCYLRKQLDPSVPEDRFLIGAILGIMHGKHRNDGTTGYLSIDMPNTFSMSPNYVRSYVEEHALEKPPVDVFGKLRERTRWLLRNGSLDGAQGVVKEADATNLREELDHEKIDKEEIAGIVTSPPYLGVLQYGSFNWIRLWFLGADPKDVDSMLDATGSIDKYVSFIASFLLSAGRAVEPDTPVIMVIGDVEQNGQCLELAYVVWNELDGITPFECEMIVEDDFGTENKTTRIWGEDKKGQATPRDRVLVLRRD
jgi:site-specific DNA-methyltransferase (adenine-specific)